MGFERDETIRIDERSGGLGEVGRLAGPLVLSQMLMTAMGVADSIIVGRLGASELASVGLAGMWIWSLSAFFVGAATAIQTFAAQEHGAGRSAQAGGWCWQGIASVVPIALAASVLVFLGADLVMTWLAPSETVAPLARGYMRARSFGVAGIVLAVALSSFFRGIGDARTPFVVTAISNAINLFLDLGLVYGWFGFPKLSVVGAGLATAAAEWCYALIMLAAFLRAPIRRVFRTEFVRPRMASVLRLWQIGLPIAGQWVTEMVALALFTTIIARMGDAAFIAVLFLAIPETLVGLFADDPAVLAYVGPLVMVGALFHYCDAMAIVTDGALRGARETTWPFIARILVASGVMLPLAWTFAFAFDGGLTGAWFRGRVAMALLDTLLVYRFRSGAWRSIQI